MKCALLFCLFITITSCYPRIDFGTYRPAPIGPTCGSYRYTFNDDNTFEFWYLGAVFINGIGKSYGKGTYKRFGRRIFLTFDEQEDESTKITKQEVSCSQSDSCLLYTSPSPRDKRQSRMPSSA